MKSISAIFACIFTVGSAQNLQVTSDGLIISTQGSDGGLLLQAPDRSDPIELSLPPAVNSFDDISLAGDDKFLFALSTSSPTAVCSYSIVIDIFTLIGCETSQNIAVSPFTGISARDGVCVVSGGTGGMTVLEYSTEGVLNSVPRFLNEQLANVVGFPDVQVVNADLAVLSTDFSGSGPRFGTTVVDLNTGLEVHNFRVGDSLGFQFSLGPANFPLVNALYEDSSSGAIYMYTANGGMTVQNVEKSGTTQGLAAPSFSAGTFLAVSVAVDHEMALLVVGGIVGGSQSAVAVYDVSADPAKPELIASPTLVDGRITSVGANGGTIACTGQGTGIEIIKASGEGPSVASPTTSDPGSGEPMSSSSGLGRAGSLSLLSLILCLRYF